MTEPKVYFEGGIADWRVSDGAADDLTETQRQPWPVKVTEGGYGGLFLELTAPDGTLRSVAVEIDQGNVRLVVFRDRDECDAIVTVQDDGVHVQAMVGGDKSYLFNEDGVRATSGAPKASFGDGGAAATPG